MDDEKLYSQAQGVIALSLGQIIYTSSRFSLDAPNIGLHNEPGFHVYSCSKGLTQEELHDFLKYKEYEIPMEFLAGITLPNIEFSPEVPRLFPLSYSYFRLSSGKYAVMQSCYSGVEYSGRRGNTFSHALVFDKLPQAFNPITYINSPSFKSCLSQLEASDKTVDYLDCLEDIQCGNTLPECDEKFAKWALDVIAQAFENGKSVILSAGASEIISFLNVVFSMLPRAFVHDLYFTTFSPKNMPVNSERKGIYRIAGTDKLHLNIDLSTAYRLGYKEFEIGTEVMDSYVYEFLIYARYYCIDDEALREMDINCIEKLLKLAKVFKKINKREVPEELATLIDTIDSGKVHLLISHLLGVYVHNSELLDGFDDFWNLVNQKVNFNSLPHDVGIVSLKLLAESILSGANYSTADIMKLKVNDAYIRVGEYCFSHSFLEKLNLKLIADELEFAQVEQMLMVLLICRKYDMQCYNTFDKNNTVITAYAKYGKYIKLGAMPANMSVLLYSTIFMNEDEADMFCKQQLFQIFASENLNFDYELVDVHIRENVANHILNTMLSYLSASDENVRWEYLDRKDVVLRIINNLKHIQADTYFEDISSTITRFYEYIGNGDAEKLNNAFRQLKNTSKDCFDKIVPNMVFTALQLPFNNQDTLVGGLEFSNEMWQNYLYKIEHLFGEKKININAVVNYVAFFYQHNGRNLFITLKYDIENTINAKFDELLCDWHNFWDIKKIKKMLKLNYKIEIDFKKEGLF